MSQQGLQQASIRTVTGTTGSYEGDWLALCDLHSIAAGTYNERVLGWINAKLVASHTDLPAALQALAVDAGAYNFSSLGTFDATAP